mmetsp:Transcript_63793/g.167043  ORF Transcript_63793/g.167043 Transcript_63793/m.167043 type:complete len:332 (-) Transcript_63793:350-1345(-)
MAVNSSTAVFFTVGAKRPTWESFWEMNLRASPIAAWAARTRCSVSLMACIITGRRSSAASTCRGAEQIATFSTSSSAKDAFSMAAGSISSSCLPWRLSCSCMRLSSSPFSFSSSAILSLVTLLFFNLPISSLMVAWSVRRRPPRATSSALSSGGAFWAARPSVAMARWVSAKAVACMASSFWASSTASSSRSPSRTCWAISRASVMPISISAAFSVAFCTRSSHSVARAWVNAALSCTRLASLCVAACFLSAASFSAELATTISFFTGPSQGIVQPVLGGVGPASVLRDQTCAPPTWLPNHQPWNAGPSLASQKYRKTSTSSCPGIFWVFL